MSISQRIEGTIENWRTKWGEILKGWMASWFKDGIEKIMDFLEPDLRSEIKPSLLRLREIEGMPDDFKSLIDKTIEEPKAIHLAAILPYLIGMLIGMGMGAAAPVSRIGSYQIDQFVKSFRLDPASIITAWRRNKAKYEPFFQDLKDQGWTDDRIEALKFFTLYYPSPAELIHWTAREVFEPDKVSKYGLMADADKLRREDFYKAGMDDEQIDNHWIAHWEHASWMQIIEMLHRGIINEQDVKDWFPLVEIAPYWAENLIQIAYTWPTRVDVRRWWDMRTIDETRLRELYEGMGYRGKNLEDYIKWTKVYTDFPMMIARFKNGWITEEDIRSWLRGLEIPEERINQFIQEKTKPEKPERVIKERDLTKADIYKGVKKEVISWTQGEELLQDLGYDEFESKFILAINVGALEGSPETYPEFKQWTQAYRKAIGLSAMEVPQEIIEASKEVAEAKEALRQVEIKERTDISEAQAQTALTNAEYRYRQLLIKWEAEKKSQT